MYSDNFVKSKLNIGGFLPLPPLIKLTAMIFESGTKHPSYQIRYADKGNSPSNKINLEMSLDFVFLIFFKEGKTTITKLRKSIILCLFYLQKSLKCFTYINNYRHT
jgi:p-aminobenzoyl-glutamate transporter AbgT